MSRVLHICALAALLATAACRDDAVIVNTWILGQPDGGEPAPVTLPADIGGELRARGKVFTLRADVELEPAMRGAVVTFAIPLLSARVELEVDGRAIPKRRSVLERARDQTAHAWLLPPDLTEDGTLALVLTVHDSWFQSTRVEVAPRLHAGAGGGAWYETVAFFNQTTHIVALSITALMGALYAVLAFVRRRRKAYLWIALQAFAATLYPAMWLGVLHPVFGGHDVQVGGAAIGLAGLASVGYTHALFGLPAPSRLWWALAALQIGSHILSTPFSLGVVGAVSGSITLAIVLVHQVAVHVRLIRRGQHVLNAGIGLVSWIFIAALAPPDLAAWTGLPAFSGGLRTVSLGLIGFAVLQTIALGREHLDVIARLDDTARDLAARIDDLEASGREKQQLTVELRRQVSERSRQLSRALTRLASTARGRAEPAVGDVVDGRYEVVERIGAGAMGAVFRVTRLEDGAGLAMKVMVRESDAMSLARFAREAHVAAEVVHDNVVALHDVDFASSGFAYIVMELVDGRPLSACADELVADGLALDALSQVARGLAAIHDHGVVHRDLKPDNILVVRRETAVHIKIADFGVSGLIGETKLDPETAAATDRLPTEDDVPPDDDSVDDVDVVPAPGEAETITTVKVRMKPPARGKARKTSDALTEAGALLGTPAYMAPEAAGGPVSDARARDVFSFGVIAFELLAGRRPFDRAPVFDRLRRNALTAPTALNTAVPSLDPTVGALVDRCLSFAPDARPTAAELASVLGSVE